MRIGVDVGGTNTDAVVMQDTTVRAWNKSPTTLDVSTGVRHAISSVIATSEIIASEIDSVMIGTTHFTNAVIERKHLLEVAVIRLGLPATASVPPMTDWPRDLSQAVGRHIFMLKGGYEFDGRPISELDEDEVRACAHKIKSLNLKAAAITGVFSPVNNDMEQAVCNILREINPDLQVSLSHEIGQVGLLQRENSTILNAALSDLAAHVVNSFERALIELGITAPFYISQNDGTLMQAHFIRRYPVLTFASGPTNSMRGAALLANLSDAMVVDIGGTTSDIGMLRNGFPRQSTTFVDVGGVRTNFRMPDILAIGLGGGSLVEDEGRAIGPQSVGFELLEKALVFGGDTLTATDIAVASGRPGIGDCKLVAHLPPTTVRGAQETMRLKLDRAIDRMKTEAGLLPVVIVGGGAILVDWDLTTASEIVLPKYGPVANAIGAAIAQVAGEVDRIVSLEGSSREEVLELAKAEAIEKAITAGAIHETIDIVEIEEVPIAYLPGNATRLRVKAVGDLAISAPFK